MEFYFTLDFYVIISFWSATSKNLLIRRKGMNLKFASDDFC